MTQTTPITDHHDLTHTHIVIGVTGIVIIVFVIIVVFVEKFITRQKNKKTNRLEQTFDLADGDDF